MYESTGTLLREQRGRAGVSQSELARLSGVSESSIARLEAGEYEHPHDKTIRLLAKALGIRYAALLGCEFDKVDKVEEIVPFNPDDPTEGGAWSY